MGPLSHRARFSTTGILLLYYLCEYWSATSSLQLAFKMAESEREHTTATPERPQQADRKERHSSLREDRQRSRSPRRDRKEDKSRRKDKGFKWKDKRRDDDGGRERDGGYQRGYRDVYKPRSRSRSPRRDRSPKRTHSPRRSEKYADENTKPVTKDKTEDRKEKKEKKEKKPAVAAPQQPMILVTVNDRLGTKKAIPCFASDTVGQFKIIVASMVGRQPHEILLKRQGERPFKDQLTLQDYGVSNNVQLDLEVDTGD